VYVKPNSSIKRLSGTLGSAQAAVANFPDGVIVWLGRKSIRFDRESH
jgi:hypothetical protein